jgi:uncharacterized Zn finger protein (UPF0148 family)
VLRICPACHSDLLTVTNGNLIECPICDINGNIKVDSDEIAVTFSEKSRRDPCLTLADKFGALDELNGNIRNSPQRANWLRYL